jgi:hypothetical protein
MILTATAAQARVPVGTRSRTRDGLNVCEADHASPTSRVASCTEFTKQP